MKSGFVKFQLRTRPANGNVKVSRSSGGAIAPRARFASACNACLARANWVMGSARNQPAQTSGYPSTRTEGVGKRAIAC